MKKYIKLFIILFLNVGYSQIGINTTNPQAIFHIDGNKDNLSIGEPTDIEQMNDFTVNKEGQIGIGVIKPDPSAVLEIKSNDKGILIPKVNLTSKDMQLNKKPNAVGLLVYNKNESSTVSKGYNYWDGTTWLQFVTTNKKQQDNYNLTFIKTDPTYSIKLEKGVDKEITPLTYTYIPERNGSINITSYLYCQIDGGSTQSLSNTFFKINVFEDDNEEPYTYLGSATAFNFESINNNPASTLIRAVHPVKAGHKYLIKTFAQEGFDDENIVRVGTFIWRKYYSYSFLEVNFVSEPY